MMALLREKTEVQEDEIQRLTNELEALEVKSQQDASNKEPLSSLHQYSGHVRKTLTSSVKSNDKPMRGNYRGQISKFM